VKTLFRVPEPIGAQGWLYDVAPDGQRFLMIMPQQITFDAAPPPPTIVVNWVPCTER
jgi:hypothetical protein